MYRFLDRLTPEDVQAIAAQAMVEGGGTLSVNLENVTLKEPLRSIDQVLWPGDYVRFAVADSGEGIPAEHLPRIFERFYKVDRSRHKEGSPSTGLGLAIAQQIVQAHGGEISVRSVLGQGTIFTVSIPMARIDDCPQAVNSDGNS